MKKIAELNILKRLRAGEQIPMTDPEYGDIRGIVDRTKALTLKLNNATTVDEIRSCLSEVIDDDVDSTTVVFTPLFTNIGVNIKLGTNVFINHSCSLLDLGGIDIHDDVMIGPRVNITSENHPVDPVTRKTMVPGKVVIKKNVWIGAAATILPGVTIGENSVVAAGAVVNRDVPANTVVAGVPAKFIKNV